MQWMLLTCLQVPFFVIPYRKLSSSRKKEGLRPIFKKTQLLDGIPGMILVVVVDSHPVIDGRGYFEVIVGSFLDKSSGAVIKKIPPSNV